MKFLKAFLITTYGVSLAVANITAAKIAFFDIPFIGGVAVPAGFVAIGVSFLCTDLISELYGRDVARATVFGTVGALVIAFALVYVSILLPAAPFYQQTTAFNTIMGQSGIIVAAAICTTLVSQNIDVSVFHHLKSYTDGGHKWLRNLGSTGVSQFADTALFITLGFIVLPWIVGASTVTIGTAVTMIIGQYVVKLVVAAADTPLFYLLSSTHVQTESVSA